MKIPEVLLVEVEHAPGSLAKMLTAVGECGVTIEALQAQSRTQSLTLWELTLNLPEGDHSMYVNAINSVECANVVGRSDRVFTRHEGGKIHTRARMPIDSLSVLRDVYTPGVARVCRAIERDPSLADKYTNRPRTVAIITNGTAILGLGDIGPLAGLPVMEGKAALFQTLAGLSGVPILIESRDAKTLIETIANIAPSFGAIQLEDIAAPVCFEVEEALQARLDIPVLHDDQHGTAVVALAGVLSGMREVGMDPRQAKIGQVGLGAAGIGIGKLLKAYGVNNLIGTDLSEEALVHYESFGGKRDTLQGVMAKADVIISTTGVRGLIKPEWVRKGQVVFALSNPDPEIEPIDALKAGARFAADGKNINNVLGFPGLFAGALQARAKKFTPEMLIAAAESISAQAPKGRLVPGPLNRSIHTIIAKAVADAAKASGA
ncbi:MAG: malate dehydrogenase (oxaloacetate-decarboxylating) [Planctomycetota bacterium]|jgi:malate dehydrogenase (oxaloacetate-decarboxylating)